MMEFSGILARIRKLLAECNTGDTHLPPTVLFNEGWMVRLLTQISVEVGLTLKGIPFGTMRHWYSEGLLASPFLPVCRGDKLSEGYTHADMTLGDFKVIQAENGRIQVSGSEGHFGVIEAKMGSPLSRGTSHAPTFDQASRNLACLAFNTRNTRHDIFFAVAAPAESIRRHNMEKMVDRDRMLQKIARRFDMYREALDAQDLPSDAKERYRTILERKEAVLNRAAGAHCAVIPFEDWLAALDSLAPTVVTELQAFYDACLRFNRLV